MDAFEQRKEVMGMLRKLQELIDRYLDHVNEHVEYESRMWYL